MAEPAVHYPFLKGHGTHNDFVLLPDHDGTLHRDLDPARVRALCDRRGGIGGDGVLRVLRAAADSAAQWFMDYRNADGSVSEMCGNGIRVFARHLVEEGLADPARPLPVDTRDGIKTITFADGAERGTPYRVDLPGGTLTITWQPDGRVLMSGPAVIVARGTTSL